MHNQCTANWTIPVLVCVLTVGMGGAGIRTLLPELTQCLGGGMNEILAPGNSAGPSLWFLSSCLTITHRLISAVIRARNLVFLKSGIISGCWIVLIPNSLLMCEIPHVEHAQPRFRVLKVLLTAAT